MEYTGIGYRREIADAITQLNEDQPAFIEIAPENWIGMGGFWGRELKKAAEKYEIKLHGLSLSIGAPDPLDMDLLHSIKAFMSEYKINFYSEHLSFSQTNNAHIYDLLPIPFTEEAIKHITEKIRIAQDYLELPLILENASYYLCLKKEMEEVDFINQILEESNCQLLLDVNNVFVNAFNHKYDAKDFIRKLDLDRVNYIHIAGHDQVSEDLIIDTHGSPVIDPVYELLDFALGKLNPTPILLERDFNIPEMEELQSEMNFIEKIAQKHWKDHG